ncbi:class II fructose-bisphosphatase [Niallia sp. FSL W8-0635]|uniref:class II fructose-bisphosphatase n=1 Tax=Niallia sp. FSL W8-0635 TaxID=2975337 RepID=UPI0009D17F27|nr:Fructose-1,6-bisphosphatase class 2 [Mycobacteroides abscessus subsp. abscessus]HEO8418766.1 class II fructose-bisphosphatase [Yersinia enterocolitica]HEO8422811.1 class II fructose-bisphosphatase [Yersinia enterocolitica]
MKSSNIAFRKDDVQSLAIDFLAISQKAAIASFPWIGKGNKNLADGAGTESLRKEMNKVDMQAVIVIGEGEMDEAPMLYIGEELGTGKGPSLDIAVDPVEGTTLLSKGQDNSLCVIAASARGSLLHAPDMYMEKIAVGPKAKGCINIEWSLMDNIKAVAQAQNKEMKDITVMIQDRPRHHHLIEQVFSLGASVRLFSDVDITAAIATAIDESDVDLFVGTGGAPEGVISATALKCLGGDFQGKLIPKDQEEYDRCVKMGITNPNKVLKLNDIIRSEDCFFVATGITNGMLLQGVRSMDDKSRLTHSFVTIGGDSENYQFIEAKHSLK